LQIELQLLCICILPVEFGTANLDIIIIVEFTATFPVTSYNGEMALLYFPEHNLATRHVLVTEIPWQLATTIVTSVSFYTKENGVLRPFPTYLNYTFCNYGSTFHTPVYTINTLIEHIYVIATSVPLVYHHIFRSLPIHCFSYISHFRMVKITSESIASIHISLDKALHK